jgi:membrane fusion protein (multidrug efflux system)
MANDVAEAAVEQAQSAVKAARETLRATESRVAQARGRFHQSTPVEAQIRVARANVELGRARENAAEAQLRLSRLELSYTRVVAPASGTISRLTVHPGQIVQAGQPVAEFVPRETYVVANFKETDAGRIRPGQRAKVAIDAYPGRALVGTVESLSAGTGARFALLPPDNATGNFVKVVQRVPARIAWNPPPDLELHAGLSVEVTVYTN